MTATTTPPYKTLSIFALIVGGLLLVLSLCAFVIFAVVPLLSGSNAGGLRANNALATNTEVLSIFAFALGYGALLLFIGRGLRRNTAVSVLRLPPPIIFIAAFLLVLIIGQVILSIGFGSAYLFPIWHVLASLLVPLSVLAFAVRRLPPVSLRSMLAQFSWGGLVTIALALVLELIIGVVLTVIALAAIALIMGPARVQELAALLRTAPNDTSRLIEFFSAQPLTLAIAGVAVFILFVIVVPLLEEVLKATGPAILIARHVSKLTPPTPAQVVLWGLAAGAGYTFTENMFNGQGAVAGAGGAASFWAAAMLLRAGTSLLHMVATATVAVGWYQALVAKNNVRLLLLLAAAFTAHAVWNTAAVMLGGVSIVGGGNNLLSSVLSGCVLLFLAALFVGFLFALWRLIRWAQPPPIEIITSSGTLLELKG